MKSHLDFVLSSLRMGALAVPLALAIGVASAFFLAALDRATQMRLAATWLLFALPLVGAATAFVYERFGAHATNGTDLIIDEIHEPNLGVPRRIVPLVLFATLATHLGGGSAGREGTALQMGAGLAAAWHRTLKLPSADLNELLLCGVAAGFGAVFGTPFAGAVFALEFLARRKLRIRSLAPCLVASFVGDWTTRALGIHHTHYGVAPVVGGALLFVKIALAAVAFGLVAALFVSLTHGAARAFKKHIAKGWLRPVVGGALVIALTFAVGTRDYLGIGTFAFDARAVTIGSCFRAGGADMWSWWWKIAFTAITLGSGFKGGEVTPLFFIGAAAGNTLALWLDAPVDLFAALGFAAVFGAAAKTPLACTVLALELFGTSNALWFACACFIAVACSGPRGLYHAQR